MKSTFSAIAIGLLFWVGSLQAEETTPPGLETVPEPPPLPAPVQSGETLEPEVTIVQRKDAVVEEYRINGVLYMIQVKPNVGPSYYLIDNDGDGTLESRRSQLYEDYVVPQWVIFSW